MGFEAGFADGAPAAALAVLARRLGRTVDAATLRERFFASESPHSLKALVEIAGEMGLGPRAFRAEIASLDDVKLPAVVHLNDPARDESGFAVLVERSAAGCVLEEGVVPDRHELSAREFAKLWSGIVVTFEPGERGVPAAAPRAGALWRAVRWFRGGDLAAPVNEVSQRVAIAAGIGLGLVAAVRLGVAEHSVAAGAAASVAVVATLVGAIVSRTLYAVGRRSLVPTATPRLASKLCKRGTHADCEGVLSSRYASILGVDLSSLGLAFFGSNLLLLAQGAVLPGEPLRALVAWLAVAYVLAVPGALWMIGVQVYPLRRYCMLCMTCHAVVLVAATLGIAWLVRVTPGISAVQVAAFAVLHAASFAAALGLVVPWLGLGLEVRSHRTRLGWIAATPWGALAEMLGRPRATAAIPSTALRIGAPDAPFRLDAVVHPACPGCGPVVDKIERLIARHPTALTAQLHVPPRDLLRRGDVALCEALYAVGRSGGGPRALALFRAAKDDPWRIMSEAERDLGGLLLRFAGDRAAAEAAMPAAADEVRAADRLYETLKRGTPTVLLNGKPWESSLEDLDALLSRFPDLLAALLRVARGTASAAKPGADS